MRLNDALITSFIYEGKEYQIDLSFDKVLDAFDIQADDYFRDHEKAETCIALLTGQDVKGIEAIKMWNYIFTSFIKFENKQPIEYDLKGNPMPVMEDEEQEPTVSIEQDAEYIYSSFRQAYDINLHKEHGKLHWHEFKALLDGLPSDTIMQRIINIRLWKPTKGDSVEYRDSMRKLQKIYALNDME